MSKKRFILCTLLNILTIAVWAQSDDFGVWTNLDFKKKLFNGFDITAGGEFRTEDNSRKVERWGAEIGFDYVFSKGLKAEAGYNFIYNHILERTTSKGNIVSAYWTPRHRGYASLTADIDFGRFNLSLRERYQYTYRPERSVSKYSSSGTQKDDEIIIGKSKSVIRTRPMIKYNIKRSGFKPYLSFELYNSINDNFSTDKTKLRVGTQYKLNKRHSFDFYYLFMNHSDDDEPRGHVIGLGYTYTFK